MLWKSNRRAARAVTHFKATARAHPNIALVKYWGKRDEKLILPHQSSLSVTLAPLSVTTTVEFGVNRDNVVINDRPASESETRRVRRVLDRIAGSSNTRLGPARVVSRGDFPEAAGLASSAAAYAALAVAAQAAAKLPADVREASILARLGSGSAARSVEGGFCQWHRGARADGDDSFAEQLYPETHWPELRLIVAVVSDKPKSLSSRDGMRRTVETSPYYSTWVSYAEAELPIARRLIRDRDLPGLGELSERNAWRMHAAAIGSDPPLCYLKPETLRLVASLPEARRGGLRTWFTLDAGPNPVFLTDDETEESLSRWLTGLGVAHVIPCRPGGSAQVLSTDLF